MTVLRCTAFRSPGQVSEIKEVYAYGHACSDIRVFRYLIVSPFDFKQVFLNSGQLRNPKESCAPNISRDFPKLGKREATAEKKLH